MQMCGGVSREEAKRLRLPREPLRAFAYLAGSGCTRIPGTDDGADLGRVREAMAAVGVDPRRA